MNRSSFRAYDIRGIADTDLDNETVELIGKAYGTMMKRHGHSRVSVGRDVRLTSERIKNGLTAGILSTGIDVIDVGVAPTPLIYFSIVHLQTDGSVMVTGSHNPIEYNGLKLNEGLLSLFGEQIQDLRRLIEAGDFEEGNGSLSESEIIPAYQRMLKERIVLKRPFKLVIDAGNGTAGPVAPEVFRHMGCEVRELYCEPDGRFPNHLPDPTVPAFVEDLQRAVVADRADLGLGYDGDSDRVGVIDDRGRMIFADQILALLSREVLARNPGAKIIFDVKCSQLLPEVIEAAGGEPVIYKTGHSLIKKKLKEEGAPLAGEMSGHIFFKDGFFGFDDGIYVSFRLLQFLSGQEKKLSELVDGLPRFHSSPEIRITCPDDEKFEVVARLTEAFRREYEVIDIDGARVLFGDGWGLVRASNTQPILVLRFEAKTEKRLQEITALFKEKLSAFPHVAVHEMDGSGGGH
ncbi:phosphomannomutase/phosphoglucomutase [bacterium]|nr:phosphomannomutase/phosphoglucomutase [bacterium]